MSIIDWEIAAVGVSGAVVGGFVGGITPYLTSWYVRPKLRIDFRNDENNVVTVEGTRGDGKVGADIFVRVRVQNGGRSRAKSCNVFVTSVHEVRADGSLHLVLRDSKVLNWAGGSRLALDVPQRVEFYVDLLRVSKDEADWGMIFGLFNDQQKLQLYSGTYRFSLLISGDNASPSTCSMNVEYRQDWNTLRAWQVT
jgi:hypothetical protein